MKKKRTTFFIKIVGILIIISIVILVIEFKRDKIVSSLSMSAPTKDDPVPIKRAAWEFAGVEPPFKITEKAISEGKIIFQKNCASCHGRRGYKTDHPLAMHGLHHVNADYIWFVTRGKSGTAMPSFKKSLSYKDRWKVILYVHARIAGREPMRMANGTMPAYLSPEFEPGDYFKLGEWYFNKNEFIDASIYYKLAYMRDPKNIIAANDLALSFFYAGKTDRAVKIISDVAKKVPSSQQIWLTYGFIEKSIDTDKAAAAFRHAIKLGPQTAVGLAAGRYLEQIK
ncbi:MAG: hypothetical protein IEMM0003_0445 [bacterium]|nr:MAG: hypothetical protein IEMM0003_0445 [bacterium]